MSSILILHSGMNHRKRNLHMNQRTLIFKLLLNGRLKRHKCEAYQLLIDELLNLDLKRVKILYRMPYVSCIISACGIAVMLMVVGNLRRLDLFRHNCPNINQYMQKMCMRHKNWIILRMSPIRPQF